MNLRTLSSTRSPRRRRIETFATIGAIAALIGLVVAVDRGGAARTAPPLAVSTVDELARLNQLIEDTERATASIPTSSSLDLLASLYLRRARINGDAASYDRANQVVSRALDLAPGDVEGQILRARILYANHRFTEARAIGEQVNQRGPQNNDATSVVADAALETGDIDTAERLVDELREAAPDSPSVYIRQSRLAFLRGQAQRAEVLAQQARRIAPTTGAQGSDLAFYDMVLGQLAFDRGDFATARQHFDGALTAAPGDRGATLGQARTLAAQGNRSKALLLLQASTEQFPDPAALALLGDLETLEGNSAGAAAAYELVEATATLARANQQIYNRQVTMYLADHNLQHANALAMAEAELLERKDIYAYDAHAWAAYRAGQFAKAWASAQKAMSLGTADAAIYAHAGLIAAARRDNATARTLLDKSRAINPQFHPLVAPEVQRVLTRLNSSSKG